MPKKKKKKEVVEVSSDPQTMEAVFDNESKGEEEPPHLLQATDPLDENIVTADDSQEVQDIKSIEHRPLDAEKAFETEDGNEIFCDGPGAGTRSKMGQEPYGKLSSPSFLVQIPFYALKKEKNRKCSVCGKHGRTPSDLLRHMRVHTGERPFPCVGCDKKFKCKRSQLTHQYLTHNITEGLSSHRLQILELKKMRRPQKSSFAVNYELPPVLENQAVQENSPIDQEQTNKQPQPIDQDEDTEIVAGEETSSNGELKTTFEGFFTSLQDSQQVVNEEKPMEIVDQFSEMPSAELQDSKESTNKQDDALQENETPIPQLTPPAEEISNNDVVPEQQTEQLKVPILRIKTHKCTHCKRQFRSIYTLRYHLRSMHDEKVYLSPALESRLKKRRWLPPHVRLQKPKINLSLGLLLKNRTLNRDRPVSENSSDSKKPEAFDEEPKQSIPSPTPTFPAEIEVSSTKCEQKQEDLQMPADNAEPNPSIDIFNTPIKTEKQDSLPDEANDQETAQNTDLNNNSSTLRNILTSKESIFNHLNQYSSFNTQFPGVTSANTLNKSASNSYIVPPHIFLPSNSQLDERLENNKPVSWESLRVTSENVLVTKMEAIHPTTQQKYVLYKCSQCGKAFSGLRAISVHLASHNDNMGKDCEKCGASFKWQNELDSHMECHRADRKYMPSSQFLPSYYVNPFPIPVVPTGDQAVMPTTGLLSYPFFPMPQQISPLVQPGFFPFFAAAALQPPSQIPLSENVTTAPLNTVHSPPDVSKESLEEKNLSQNCSFQCKLCPKTFDRIFSLQRHERIHSGVKACFCKTCGRGFSELRNLRHHIVRFHADTAKMEPLPYRRQPTRVRSSSQRLVSFLKKTAVRILNSMGQNKLDPPASSVKIQTDDLVGDAESQQSDDVPQNLTINQTQPNEINNCVEQISEPEPPQSSTDMESDSAQMTNALEETKNAVNYVKVPELEDLPTVNGSPILNDTAKSSIQTKSNNSASNRPLEVMHDPKRSLLGNRRKGRPFKLSTTTNTCTFLNPLAEENLFTITQKILNGMPKLNIEQPTAFLQTPQPSVGTSVPNELTMPQLPFFNSELPNNEPIDMSNVRETKTPQEIKTEPNQNKDPICTEATPTYPSLSQINEALTSNVKLLQSSEGKCMFPCSYCHRSFSTLSDLNRHMTFHADIRPFKCPYCSYCSRTNSQLKVHMMRHEGIKHYMCQICNYNGVTQSDLNRHLKTRTHLLRSRNICACCGTGFHTRSLSEEHYKSCRLLSSTNGQEATKNVKETPGRLVMENKNRGNRLKHVQKPKEEIEEDPLAKKEFFKNLYELGKMGVPFASFLQQNNVTNAVK